MAKPWKRGPVTCIYARNSTDKQENSIPVQVEKLTQFAEKNGEAFGLQKVKRVFEEWDTSGRTEFRERPAARDLIRMMQEDDTLLVTRLDRLGRSTIDIVMTVNFLSKRKIRLIILDIGASPVDTKSPTGKMFLSVMASFAEFERDLIAQRTAEALADLRRQGKRVSRFAPRGFKFDAEGQVVEDLEMQVWYGRMLQMRDGGATFDEIADHLVTIGAPTPRAGVGWNSKNVGRAIRWAIKRREVAMEGAVV